MTTNGATTGSSTWAGDTVVLACVIVAVLPMGFLHLAGSTAVDPLVQTISDYVVVPGGYALLGVSAVALAVAGAVLAVGLGHAALPRPRPLAALLASWSVALVLVALFPTNAPGAEADVAATVHRYAGAWVFAGLPVIGWLAARRARETPAWAGSATSLAWWSGVAGVLSIGFLLAHVPSVLGLAASPLLGGVERGLYAAFLALLVATARATRMAVDGAAAPAVAQRTTRTGIGEAA